ncbi:MAG: hypothetical protein BJ554DRAFT_4134, partial [Olpidium bornovanus]
TKLARRHHLVSSRGWARVDRDVAFQTADDLYGPPSALVQKSCCLAQFVNFALLRCRCWEPDCRSIGKATGSPLPPGANAGEFAGGENQLQHAPKRGRAQPRPARRQPRSHAARATASRRLKRGGGPPILLRNQKPGYPLDAATWRRLQAAGTASAPKGRRPLISEARRFGRGPSHGN